MKRVAVLSSNYGDTLKWLRDTFNIIKVDNANQWLEDSNEYRYFIVDDFQKAYGDVFDFYIKSPTYRTLEDVLRARIR